MPTPVEVTATIYPSLTYDDAPAAIDWLCRAFGFEKRLVVPKEDGGVLYSELSFGGAVVMVSSPKGDRKSPRALSGISHALSLHVDDPDAHCERAKAAGARIVSELRDEDFGARGYMAADPEGHQWCFSTYVPGKWWDADEG